MYKNNHDMTIRDMEKNQKIELFIPRKYPQRLGKHIKDKKINVGYLNCLSAFFMSCS